MAGARRACVLRTGAALSASLAFHLAVVGVGARLADEFSLTGPDGGELRVELIDAEPAPAAGSRPGRPRGTAPVAIRSARAAPGQGAWPAVVLPPVTAGSDIEVADAGETMPSEGDATLVVASAAPDLAAGAEVSGSESGASPASHAPEGVLAPTSPGPESARSSSVPASETAVAPPSSSHAELASAAVAASPDAVTAQAERAPERVAAAAESPAPVALESPGDVAEALMTSPVYERLREVALNPSVSASARSETMVGRREVLEFLLDHPEFASHVTRALRLARYRVWRTDDGFFLDDGWGATGQVSMVYAAHGTRVLYARGEFQGKLLPTIPGEALVTIEYDVQPGEDGKDRLSAAVTGQLRLEGAFAELALRLARASAVEKAEKETRRLVRIVARVLRATEEAPEALYASLRARPGVPERQLEEFRALLRIP